ARLELDGDGLCGFAMLFGAGACSQELLLLLVPLPFEFLAARGESSMTRHGRRAPVPAVFECRNQCFAFRVEVCRRAVEGNPALAGLIELRARCAELGFRVTEQFLPASRFSLRVNARFL